MRDFFALGFQDGWDSRPYLFATFAASREDFFTNQAFGMRAALRSMACDSTPVRVQVGQHCVPVLVKKQSRLVYSALGFSAMLPSFRHVLPLSSDTAALNGVRSPVMVPGLKLAVIPKQNHAITARQPPQAGAGFTSLEPAENGLAPSLPSILGPGDVRATKLRPQRHHQRTIVQLHHEASMAPRLGRSMSVERFHVWPLSSLK